MKILNQPARPEKPGLRLPQIRVLQVLWRAYPGALTRSRISDRCGNKTGVVVGRAIGYSDPVKRAAFEQTKDGGGSPGDPCPSLLTLGYVREIEIDVDGVTETAVELTEEGKRVYLALGYGDTELPPLRD